MKKTLLIYFHLSSRLCLPFPSCLLFPSSSLKTHSLTSKSSPLGFTNPILLIRIHKFFLFVPQFSSCSDALVNPFFILYSGVPDDKSLIYLLGKFNLQRYPEFLPSTPFPLSYLYIQMLSIPKPTSFPRINLLYLFKETFHSACFSDLRVLQLLWAENRGYSDDPKGCGKKACIIMLLHTAPDRCTEVGQKQQ